MTTATPTTLQTETKTQRTDTSRVRRPVVPIGATRHVLVNDRVPPMANAIRHAWSTAAIGGASMRHDAQGYRSWRHQAALQKVQG
jgi:hypothetical protein